MGSYALLSLSRSSSPELGESNSYVDGTELSYKYGIAPAWYALFIAEDIVTRQSDEGHPQVFAFTDLISAKSRLTERSQKMEEAIGDRWSQGLAGFREYLESPHATHVLLDATEYCEMFSSGQELQEVMKSCIGAFDVPVLTGKRSLLSRKPIVSDPWQKMLEPVQPNDDRAWAIFGSPPDWDFDS